MPTVESVRKELRGAIFDLELAATAANIDGRNAAFHLIREKAAVLVTFGINSHLFAKEEWRDWMDVLEGKKALAKVALAYEEKP